ncbi:Mas-related G-protein coupled receptor member B5 [Microtus ochrogaster]|uniref:Mas-related G-protein coupled receptor member B5 n=1 Tax=Microtus ochrogaster TaxID=79684 RepID=A0A8J6L231_MICOH|nr:Mas-related G-protein coupled receptor member B5 [Microtus ochrogaster]
MDPDKALCRSSGLDVIMALYGSTGHRDKYGYVGGTAPRQPHGHGWQIRHWASPWPLVTWAMGDYTASGYGRTMEPDMAPVAALAHIPPWLWLAGKPPTSAYWNTSGKFPSMYPTTPAWSTDNTTMNETYYTKNLPCIDSIPIILHTLKAGIAMVGLAGNAIVLWLLSFHIQRNAFSVYVLNLAGADFLFLSFLTMYNLELIFLHFHAIYFDIPISLTSVYILAYLAGMCIIAAISAERCLSVLWPIWYRC